MILRWAIGTAAHAEWLEGRAALDHPNIQRLFEHGAVTGGSFVAIEDVDQRQCLRDLLERGPLPEEECVRVAVEVGAAIAHANRKGFCALRMKDDSVFVAPGGPVKVLLFAFDPVGCDRVVGSPYLMSPEDVRGAPSARSEAGEVYRLGVLLYRMITGRWPFPLDPRAGSSLVTVLTQVLNDRPIDPRGLNAACSPRFARATLRALEKDPVRRQASIRELTRDLSETCPPAW